MKTGCMFLRQKMINFMQKCILFHLQGILSSLGLRNNCTQHLHLWVPDSALRVLTVHEGAQQCIMGFPLKF